MCLNGALLRGVLVLLLLDNSGAKLRCDYEEILDSYGAVILVELQNLNLTGSAGAPKDRDRCPSGKARRILGSIYAMTQQVQCKTAGKHQGDLKRPLESMEQLIIHYCSPAYLGKRASCLADRKLQGNKRKRIWLTKVIKALITCWEKLRSVYMPKE